MKRLAAFALWLTLVSALFGAIVRGDGISQNGIQGTFNDGIFNPTIPSPDIYMNFVTGACFGKCPSDLTTTRTVTGSGATATDLTPLSASGYAYNTYANNVTRVSSGFGLLAEIAATNFITSSVNPTGTAATASLPNAKYVLWMNGPGSMQMGSGTATGCGTGTATQGNPVTFTTTGTAGTCTTTATGTVFVAQIENGTNAPNGTSFIATAGASGVRSTESVLFTVLPTVGPAGVSLMTQHRPFTATAPPNNQLDFGFDDGSNANRVVFNEGSGLRANFIIANTSANLTFATTNYAPGVSEKQAISGRIGGTFYGARNGDSLQSATMPVGSMPTYTRGGPTAIGSSPNIQFQGYRQVAAVWLNLALNPVQLQAITH